MSRFKIVLLKTIPRSGATGFLHSFQRTCASISDSLIDAHVVDIDYLESIGGLPQDHIIPQSPADIFIVKTHRRFDVIMQKLSSIDPNTVLITNVFRCPFDVAASTYFYLANHWGLIDMDSLSIYEFMKDWALNKGGSRIFMDRGYPSYIEYACLALQESLCGVNNGLNFTFDKIANNKLSVFLSLVDACNHGEKVKSSMIENFRDFNIQDAKIALGESFVASGKGQYALNPLSMNGISDDELTDLRHMYIDLFADIINDLNSSFSHDLTCY